MGDSKVDGQDGNHPAYQHILDALPDDLHPVIIPELKKWDGGVTKRFQEIHDQYEPIKEYQKFAEKDIKASDVEQALYVLAMMQERPDEVVEELVKSFELPFVSKSELDALQEQLNKNPVEDDDDDDDFDLGDEMKIEDHPAFKALKDQLEELNGFKQQTEQERQQSENAKKAEEYLDNLKSEHGDFDRDYVAVLVANGVDGADAVKRYHDTVNQAAQQLAGTQQGDDGDTGVDAGADEEPPVVLGGATSGGSGLPEDNVDVGAMSRSEIIQHVASIAAAARGND